MATGVEDLVTVREAARECGCAAETIRRRIWDGKLPAKKLGNQLFIRRADLAPLLEEARERRRAARLAAIEQAEVIAERIYQRLGGYFGVLESLDKDRESHP